MTTFKQHLLCGLTALSLVAPLTSFASSTAFENGFYIGAKIGAQQAMVDKDRSSQAIVTEIDTKGSIVDSFALFSLSDQDSQLSHTNFMGNLNIGYARVLEQFFLAAELSVNLAGEQELEEHILTNSVQAAGEYQEIIESSVTLENPDIIFDLRPGFLLAKNFLLYSRIGVAYNQLSIEQEGQSNYIVSAIDTKHLFTTPISSSEKDDVFGLRIGLGVEYKLTPNLAMNVDYVFTDYGSIETEDSFITSVVDPNDSAGTVVTNLTASANADVTKNTMTAGFSWYFGGKKQQPVYHGLDK